MFHCRIDKKYLCQWLNYIFNTRSLQNTIDATWKEIKQKGRPKVKRCQNRIEDRREKLRAIFTSLEGQGRLWISGPSFSIRTRLSPATKQIPGDPATCSSGFGSRLLLTPCPAILSPSLPLSLSLSLSLCVSLSNYILWIYNYGAPQACGTRFRESLRAEY